MARSSNKDIQTVWEERISAAKKRRKDWADEMRVPLARAYFKGQQNPGFPEEEWITINKIYSHILAQLPTLYSLDPYFLIKLRRSFTQNPLDVAAMEFKAERRQDMLNYYKVEQKIKQKLRMNILDAFFAYGIVKMLYVANLVDNPDKGQPLLAEDGTTTLFDDEGNPLRAPDQIPVNERYATNRIHPDDFMWDVDAGPLEDSWHHLYERVRMTRTQAKKNKNLNNTVIDALTGEGQDKETKQEDKRDQDGMLPKFTTWFRRPTPRAKGSPLPKDNKDSDIIEWWEIYDLDNHEWLQIAPGADMPLMKSKPLPAGVELHPYGILRFTPLQDNSPYPITPVSQAMDPQKEFCTARSRLMTHRKRFNRKYIMFDQPFGESADTVAAQLETGADGTVLRASGTPVIGDPIKAIDDAPLDQQGLIEINALGNDITEVMGSPGEALGLATADSATQAALLDRRLELREGDKMSDVVDLASAWGAKMDQLVQVHVQKDEVVKITGPTGDEWRLIKTDNYENIAGEFEYGVNVGSMRPRLPDIERSQIIAFFSQVVIPFPAILTKPKVMKRFAELFHIEDDAMLKELQELGLAIIQGQIPPPGGGAGSQAGVSEERPTSAVMGSALGFTGGNVGAGGTSNV